ncbi:MAG: hypothetical protein L6R41_001272 [Letrouitia leprolyta]|nr:MAG: hypothetical protein L6R41_001272 [Letrouitia leprolyta]
MATEESPAVVFTLQAFCERREHEIYRLYTEHGGWEPWLQLELLPWLRERWTDTVATREQHVFADPNQKTDILMYPSSTFAYHTIIELKCESVFQDLTERGMEEEGAIQESLAKFTYRFKKDIQKIEKGISAKFRPAHCWVLGVTRASEAAKYPEHVNWGGYDVKYSKVGSSDIIVWSWYGLWT